MKRDLQSIPSWPSLAERMYLKNRRISGLSDVGFRSSFNSLWREKHCRRKKKKKHFETRRDKERFNARKKEGKRLWKAWIYMHDKSLKESIDSNYRLNCADTKFEYGAYFAGFEYIRHTNFSRHFSSFVEGRPSCWKTASRRDSKGL